MLNQKTIKRSYLSPNIFYYTDPLGDTEYSDQDHLNFLLKHLGVFYGINKDKFSTCKNS